MSNSRKGIVGAHTCPVHQKKSYLSRREARQAARRLYPEERMNAYPCKADDRYWHFGHLPDALRQGEIDRDIYREGLGDSA